VLLPVSPENIHYKILIVLSATNSGGDEKSPWLNFKYRDSPYFKRVL
jgi:hypothetical protein